MLAYTFNSQVIDIQEKANGQDIEFHIQLYGDTLDDKLKEIQYHFEQNRVLTDVLFYAFPNHKYQFIVRQDFYNDFILALMKLRLLQSVEWK
ncbi:hypothetical protein [Paenibacillus sedimenti]|uniref:Uncharacterized protein n=1 Tax=Paenibacillus sedimenti TaxID=2770274 RepID=A0A926KQN4_9BACL|nr:hypothetical protein [Paenibacillus sedimenti]MBD0382292.1 hypothetical protein [Paenibacillus sedimenti]